MSLASQILCVCSCVRGMRSSMIPPLLFSRLVSVTVTFVLKAINLQTVRYRELPDCYDFTVIVCGLTQRTFFLFFNVTEKLINMNSSPVCLNIFFWLFSPVTFVQITFNNKAHSGRIKIDMEHDVSIGECRDWEVIGACECSPTRTNGENSLSESVLILKCVFSQLLKASTCLKRLTVSSL